MMEETKNECVAETPAQVDSRFVTFGSSVQSNDNQFTQHFSRTRQDKSRSKIQTIKLVVKTPGDSPAELRGLEVTTVSRDFRAASTIREVQKWVAEKPDTFDYSSDTVVFAKNSGEQEDETHTKSYNVKFEVGFDPRAVLAALKTEIGETGIAEYLAVYLPAEFGLQFKF